MGVIFVPDEGDLQAGKEWKAAFRSKFPKMQFLEWPIQSKALGIRYAIVWKPPTDVWDFLPSLETIFVLGAGVDFVLGNKKIARKIQIVRLLDAGMAKPMAEYVLYAALFFQRGFDQYQKDQCHKNWVPREYQPLTDWPVGVMGVGVIGEKVANTLVANGFPVFGWARTVKETSGYKVFSGSKELKLFLSKIKILVNVLPLTSATAGLLNSEFFNKLGKGSYFINIGRGETVVEKDFLEGIESKHIEGAFLDVFCQEPLPADHPFFQNTAIYVTPHVAAPTIFNLAVDQILNNIQLIERGLQPEGLVDTEKGY